MKKYLVLLLLAACTPKANPLLTADRAHFNQLMQGGFNCGYVLYAETVGSLDAAGRPACVQRVRENAQRLYGVDLSDDQIVNELVRHHYRELNG